MHRFGLRRNRKLAFRQDIPVPLVDHLPVIRIELHQRELDNMLFLHVETRSLSIKTNESHLGFLIFDF